MMKQSLGGKFPELDVSEKEINDSKDLGKPKKGSSMTDPNQSKCTWEKPDPFQGEVYCALHDHWSAMAHDVRAAGKNNPTPPSKEPTSLRELQAIIGQPLTRVVSKRENRAYQRGRADGISEGREQMRKELSDEK